MSRFARLAAAPSLLAGFGLARLGSRLGSRTLSRHGIDLLGLGLRLRRPEPSTAAPVAEIESDFHSSDGVRLRWYGWNLAQGRVPVVLHHGFAANAHANWVVPGVVTALVDAGLPVLAIDARGHGRSEAPAGQERYGESRMASDLLELLRAQAVRRFDLVGYSMGAVVSLLLAARLAAESEGAPRLRRLVVGGVGEGVLECGGVDTRAVPAEALAQALLLDDPAQISHPGLLLFRLFAERMGGDRRALAAQARALHRQPIALDAIEVPSLVIAGQKDPLARRAERLAQALPNARFAPVPGDHLGAVARPELRAALLQFLTAPDSGATAPAAP
jgi:pimeloyl-ACP methyl ester carboxylesterase